MTILRFHGVLDSEGSGNPQTPTIGGRYILDEITETFGYRGRKVTVALADERFEGDLDADGGSTGYSEWTPGEPSCFYVGKHSLIDRLDTLDGQTVTLWIADEPVNTLLGDEGDGA